MTATRRLAAQYDARIANIDRLTALRNRRQRDHKG